MTTCMLFLILCQSRPGAVLNVAHAAAAFTDTWSTQRYLDNCIQPGRRCWERNLVTRPFQSHGKPLAYVTTGLGVVGVSAIAHRMRRSDNRVIRRIWWLPQAALIGAHAWGIHNNLSLDERHKRHHR